MSDPVGYLNLVLHAHLPFVRHPEHDDFLEERWFFEGLTETYIPLLKVFEGLEEDGVDYHLLLSLSPTLVSMMEDELLQERYSLHLHKLRTLAEDEIDRTRHDSHLNYLARWYRDFFQDTIYWFEERCRRRIALAFARLASAGRLEIMTCAATHGFLPLLRRNNGAVRGQVAIACDYHAEVFGARPEGIWVPECAYYPGLENILKDEGVNFFIMESHGIMHADNQPEYEVYAPLYTPARVAAFGRDPESSKQVWSGEEGYPGHADYREFYRDVAFDRSEEELQDILVDGHIRTDSGIKYYRITGHDDKQFYDPQQARERAALHAQDFMERRQHQVRELSRRMDRPPQIVAPYDAELFGHWWFEGPIFIDMLLRKMHYDQDEVKTSTPMMALQKTPTNQMTTPSASSWGGEGHYDFWLNDTNAWVYPLLHRAADRFQKHLEDYLDAREHVEHSAPELTGRILRQAARELLLAQGSDWTFIMRTGTSPEYAGKRVRDHLARFDSLLQMLEDGSPDERTLAGLEEIDRIFPNLNLEHLRDHHDFAQEQSVNIQTDPVR